MKCFYCMILLALMLTGNGCDVDIDGTVRSETKTDTPASSAKEITSVSFHGFQSHTEISQKDNTIDVHIDASGEYLVRLTAAFVYTGCALKKDGVLQENGVTKNNFAGCAVDPAVYTVIAEDGSRRNYEMYVEASGTEQLGDMQDLIICGWADAGTDKDYIEIKNHGENAVFLTHELTINFGRDRDGASPQSSLMLGGYSVDAENWLRIPGDGVRIAPGEHILVGDADLNEEKKLEDFRYEWGDAVQAPFKIFRVFDETTLIGTRDRLSDAPAWLSNGERTWSKTPPADIDNNGDARDETGFFGGDVGTSTCSCLIDSIYAHGSSDTQNPELWSNGSKTTHALPGDDYTE